MKRYILGFLLILTIGVLAACSEQSVENDEASDEVQKEMDEDKQQEEENAEADAETERSDESSKEEVSEEPSMAKVGDTLNVDGVKITVTDVSVFEGEINQYEPLTEDHAIEVKVIVENTNKESVFVDSSEFTLYGTEGFEQGTALPSDPMALSNDIAGGKKVKGSLFYDVPKQDGMMELHYQSMASMGGDPAIWEFQAK
ncbi:DUF4352 domain-containing protein (plasmid) [Pontibacillus sp. ALD_SL1]|uniref:DUF4352 domain-containing protein n=1 Tax=Pontibacillus sp. ALD_SL1 TaxID=2777185 RepID=UPI001A95A232|nr:DUF4352 domain-containing protein [Pontibacillus sp. ALD_SL1]QST02396.1 DUF4352 domain-containing protein [Pontibacillus sp. ALD_SL1]